MGAPHSPKRTVSLLSPSRVVLALGPRGAAAGLARGGAGGERAARRYAADPADAATPASAARGLARRAFAEFKGRAKRASVILSSHLVRQMLVPWSAEISGDEEEIAAVRHHLRRIHGDAALGWALRYSVSMGNATCVACAIEPSLIDGLREEAAASGIRLDSVQPSLAVNFNRWRTLFDSQAGLFALVEDDRYACAQFRGGAWLALNCGRLGPDLGIEGLLARQLGLAAGEPSAAAVWLRMPGAAQARDLEIEGAKVRWLRPQAGQFDAALEDAAFAAGAAQAS